MLVEWLSKFEEGSYIYLSAPMTDWPGENKEWFDFMSDIVRAQRLKPLSPPEIDTKFGDQDYQRRLMRDISLIEHQQTKGVLFHPEFYKSAGCLSEYGACKWFGKDYYILLESEIVVEGVK